eukprot:Blabericola_migrator_1__5926@NODE_299_length_10197_cov_100_341955_g246_i0_p6_GENE_NODE_299_length_10197_cov_100_341955_g246_i0NODE_299_length_10197_cov_100_341955_g246_i0_p6_ORF_typecomplete_len157_score3_03NADH_dehy_S2_C/PF06444_11/0_23_NODE_299_length_10197_cov_100_341955_g246_i085008970
MLSLNSGRQLARCIILKSLLDEGGCHVLTNPVGDLMRIEGYRIQIIQYEDKFYVGVMRQDNYKMIKYEQVIKVKSFKQLIDKTLYIIIPVLYTESIDISYNQNIIMALWADQKNQNTLTLNDIEFYVFNDVSQIFTSYKISNDGKSIITNPHLTWR